MMGLSGSKEQKIKTESVGLMKFDFNNDNEFVKEAPQNFRK